VAKENDRCEMIRLIPPPMFELTDWRIIVSEEDVGWVIEHRIAGFTFAFIQIKRKLKSTEKKCLKKLFNNRYDIVYRVREGDEYGE
jgi:hypothetical protein